VLQGNFGRRERGYATEWRPVSSIYSAAIRAAKGGRDHLWGSSAQARIHLEADIPRSRIDAAV